MSRINTQVLILALFLQFCDLILTMHVLQLGCTESNPIMGSNPSIETLVAFKIMAVFFIFWLATIKKGHKPLFYLNIIYILNVVYIVTSTII